MNSAWIIDITSIENTNIPWTIPDFPVVTITFKKVQYCTESQQNEIGLVNYTDSILPGKYMCTKHCTIKLTPATDNAIVSRSYTVLWELKRICQTKTTTVNAVAHKAKGHTMEQCASNERHTLPFKVLGTCYSKERQLSLEKAFDYMEANRPVFADLVHEPDNTHDPNAIAVYISFEGDYEKVGYLPRELTCFVHPLLQKPELDVQVKKIRFRTSYLRVGFYLTLDITKNGAWDDVVVAASKNAR